MTVGLISISRSADPNARRMQIGLTPVQYYTGFCPFLNWAKAASAPSVFATTGNVVNSTMWTTGNPSGAPYFDAVTGDVALPFNTTMTSFSRLFFQGNGNAQVRAAILAAGGDYAAVTMIADCAVGWTLRITSLGAGGSVSSGQDTREVTFTIGNGSDAAPIVRAFAVGTPTNAAGIRIYKQQYQSNINNGEIFDPSWKVLMAPFASFRTMDWTQTNGSLLTDYSQLASEDYAFWGTPTTTANGVVTTTGYLSSMPLAVICALANQAQIPEVHYCMPGRATDACMQSVAEFFRDTTSAKITFELSNECSWRSGVNNATNDYLAAQGLLIPGNPWSGDSAGVRASKYYGYRAAQMMKIISTAYGNRGRWRGGLGTQSVNTIVTNNIMVGVAYYFTLAGSGAITDLFDDILGTSYMGEPGPFAAGQQPSALNTATGLFTTPGVHGLSNGNRIKFFVATGTTQLNNLFATILTTPTTTSFTTDIDTTTFSAWAISTQNFWMPAVQFDVMDQSTALNLSDPSDYPTKYTYFNQQMATSILTGTSSSGITTAFVYSTTGQAGGAAPAGSWRDQKTIAVANGLDFRQYEGGLNWTGGPLMGTNAGAPSPQYNEFFMNFTTSQEAADMLAATYSAFSAFGDRSAHFLEGGNLGVLNAFAAMHAVPQDSGNPVWQGIVSWNRGY